MQAPTTKHNVYRSEVHHDFSIRTILAADTHRQQQHGVDDCLHAHARLVDQQRSVPLVQHAHGLKVSASSVDNEQVRESCRCVTNYSAHSTLLLWTGFVSSHPGPTSAVLLSSNYELHNRDDNSLYLSRMHCYFLVRFGWCRVYKQKQQQCTNVCDSELATTSIT